MSNEIRIDSVITCPHCGGQQHLKMPMYAVKSFYECPTCKTLHKTKKGECCIFCSYGSVRCPSGQVTHNQTPRDL